MAGVDEANTGILHWLLPPTPSTPSMTPVLSRSDYFALFCESRTCAKLPDCAGRDWERISPSEVRMVGYRLPYFNLYPRLGT